MTIGVAMNSWQVGQVKISQVIELGPMVSPARFFFENGSAELAHRNPWLKPHFADDNGKLIASIHCFIIESMGKRIVVDTCVGNDKKRQIAAWNHLNGPFLQDLTRAGFAPETIDTVLCTHLHVDHVGWNTRWVDGRWLPTFPSARYLFARKEWEHWSSLSNTGNGDDILGDSVRPIIAAGLADLVDTNHRLTDEVWLEPTPGHTPGHVSVRIESQGVHAVITGDLIHHPIQCSEPDLPVNFDSDREQARLTRRHFLGCCARDHTLVLGTHFATPTAGRVVASGETWRFDVSAVCEPI